MERNTSIIITRRLGVVKLSAVFTVDQWIVIIWPKLNFSSQTNFVVSTRRTLYHHVSVNPDAMPNTPSNYKKFTYIISHELGFIFLAHFINTVIWICFRVKVLMLRWILLWTDGLFDNWFCINDRSIENSL